MVYDGRVMTRMMTTKQKERRDSMREQDEMVGKTLLLSQSSLFSRGTTMRYASRLAFFENFIEGASKRVIVEAIKKKGGVILRRRLFGYCLGCSREDLGMRRVRLFHRLRATLKVLLELLSVSLVVH